MHLLTAIILGGIAGWLAGKVMKGDGYGIMIDIILGLAGGWVGGFVFGLLGIYAVSDIGYLVTAFVGAVLLVWISRRLKS